MFRLRSCAALIVLLAAPTPGLSQDLYQNRAFSALAADRRASRVGDSLTVLVYENASASNSTQNSSRRNHRAKGSASVGATGGDDSVELAISGAFDGGGQTERTGRMVAQISVVVADVAPNGDMQVIGEQALSINGEHTRIRLRGRVRPADIASNNTVLSSRLYAAAIDYDGAGFVTRGTRNSAVTRLFQWLGLI